MSPPTIVAPARGQRERGGLADAAAGAGEHGHPAGEVVARNCVASLRSLPRSACRRSDGPSGGRDYAGAAGSLRLPVPWPELTVASFNTHWGVDRARPAVRRRRPRASRSTPTCSCSRRSWRPHGGRRFVDEIAERDRLRSSHEVVVHVGPTTRPGPRQPPTRRRARRAPAGSRCSAALPGRDVVRHRARPHAPGRRGRAPPQPACVAVDVDGRRAVTIAGMHASHRLWGSLPQVRRVDRALARPRQSRACIVGDLQHVGPGGRARPPEPAPGRARPHLARRGDPHSQIDHIWIDDGLEVARRRGVGPPPVVGPPAGPGPAAACE